MSRVVGLDVMRGLTVSMMLVVNNGYGDTFGQLRHSVWNGLTVCDVVFPFFLFMVGVSVWLSLGRRKPVPAGAARCALLAKVLRRGVLLFLLGVALNWFEMAVGKGVFSPESLRLWGVLQRIGLCYTATALLALYASDRHFAPTIVCLLAVYCVILAVGHGYAYDSSVNILARADLWLAGYGHLYHKSPVDPEGLLSTIPAIAHTMTGYLCGRLLLGGRGSEGRPRAVLWLGLGLLAGGLLLSLWLPLNKRVWSPSFVLLTCGLGALTLLLSRLLWSGRGAGGDARNSGVGGAGVAGEFFMVFGMNPLFLYLLSEVLAVVFKQTGISAWIYGLISGAMCTGEWASLCFALWFMLLNWLVGWLLYRRGVFVKL